MMSSFDVQEHSFLSPKLVGPPWRKNSSTEIVGFFLLGESNTCDTQLDLPKKKRKKRATITKSNYSCLMWRKKMRRFPCFEDLKLDEPPTYESF